MKYYLLDENKIPYEVSLEEGLKLYDNPDMKIVKQNKFKNGVFVSTVFLGIDHGWFADKDNINYKPLLFETMIFEGEYNGYQERYTSYTDALEGHQKAINLIKSKTFKNDKV